MQHFTSMATLVQTLQASQCEHLIKFASDTLLYWYKNMRDNLARLVGICDVNSKLVYHKILPPPPPPCYSTPCGRECPRKSYPRISYPPGGRMSQVILGYSLPPRRAGCPRNLTPSPTINTVYIFYLYILSKK